MADAWAEVDLSALHLDLEGADIVVRLERLTAAGTNGQDAQWLGGDTTEPDQCCWWRSHEAITGGDGDLMIRITVQ